MTYSDDPAGRGWHLDRRVPIALIVTIFIATITGIFAYGQLHATVEDHERRLNSQATRLMTESATSREALVEIKRIEATMTAELRGVAMILQDIRQQMRDVSNRQYNERAARGLYGPSHNGGP